MKTDTQTLISTTDGIKVEKGDWVQISINGGEWMDFAKIEDKSDASFAVAKCRQGSYLTLEGSVRRNRIVRKGMNGGVVYERQSD